MNSKEKELLEEMVKWLRFMGMQEARNVVKKALTYDNEEKTRDAKIAYQLTDGENSTSDIEKYISYSYRWVSSRHQEWAKLGIVEKEKSNSSYEHIMSLDELGIESPDIPEPDDDDQTETEGDKGQATLGVE